MNDPVVPVRTLYHPITGAPIGTATAENMEAVKKMLRKAEKRQERLKAMAGYSIVEKE